jgi:prepilin-type N-terminal cleavage/methylation domain-containing protein
LQSSFVQDWYESCSDINRFCNAFTTISGEEKELMKKDQGFSLIELLIVVAIIAIIAAIAVPSMLTARMAANESSAIEGCRTIGSAEVAYSATNNQMYTDLDSLVTGQFLDSRYASTGNGFNGYQYSADLVTGGVGAGAVPEAFQFVADTDKPTGRYKYGIAPDQVVRYQGMSTGAPTGAVAPKCGTNDCVAGDPIGKN